MKSINPYTGEVIYNHTPHSITDVEKAIDYAHKAYLSWRKTSLSDRQNLMLKLAEVLEENKRDWAKTMTLEMGKPMSQSLAEIKKCAWVCRYYATEAQKQLADKFIETDASKSYVTYEPLGVILGVMPWNYPFWQVFRFAVPTIIAGNTALLKHASNVMQSAKNIQHAFELAGFPKNVFTSLIIGSNKVEAIIRHPYVKGVSLTGSKPAGAEVASTAAQEIKPSLLELGGSNALVVFEDCDLDETVKICVNARFQNTGQSCIAGKRLLVHESIADIFLTQMTKATRELISGNTLDEKTYLGTMVSKQAAEELNDQLQRSLEKGAEIVTGGNYNNAYFEPTIVKNVTKNMSIFKEETFGPLLSCTTFKTDEEAVALVNESEFGLGVSLFTNNLQRVEKLIPCFDEGAVFVNELVKSDPRLPFGGTKISGYGRELSVEGIKAFVNIKTVYIK